MSRLYVLTHEIIELEDYEKVPEEGTEILIAGDTMTRVAQLEDGLRNIVSMYGGFTNTKEMMEKAREVLGVAAPNQSICENCGKPLRDHIQPLMTCFTASGGGQHGQ
jgi:hypothetical protein